MIAMIPIVFKETSITSTQRQAQGLGFMKNHGDKNRRNTTTQITNEK